MQQGYPLTFLSRSLGPKWKMLFVYEKELLALVQQSKSVSNIYLVSNLSLELNRKV